MKIKNTLCVIGLIGFFTLNLKAQVCTPDTQYTSSGLHPDSATGLDSATLGVYYEEVITVVVPADTVISPGPPPIIIPIDSLVMTNVTGLPPGLTYGCEPPSCHWPGGTTGCILISGTPTDTGTYSLTFLYNFYLGGSPTPVSITIEYYSIFVDSSCIMPVADFSHTETNLTVSFSDSSANATSWQWNYGDGDFSALQNPTHTYASTGTYYVCLTAANACGSDTFCDSVSVSSCIMPVAAFFYNKTNLTVSFSDSSANATSWQWNYGDGDFSTLQNPTHTYASAGTYYVCLTATNACGFDTFCDSVSVSSCTMPTAAFSHTETNLTVSFSDSSANATSWQWNYGDGDFSALQNPTHTYASDGTYYVCLTATNACGSDTICDSVGVSSCTMPVAAFSHSETNLTVSFSDSSANAISWQWNYGDGDFSALQNPTHTYLTAGTYYVCLTAANACGSDTYCDSVSICIIPVAAFTYNTTALTVNFTDTSTGAISWYWNYGDGDFSTQQNPSHTYPVDGSYYVCLTAANTCGADTFCDSVNVLSTGLQDLFLHNAIKIYPNPNTRKLIIELPKNPVNLLKIRFLNLSGQVIYEEEISGSSPTLPGNDGIYRKEINLSGYAKGIYFLQIIIDEVVMNRKVVLE